MSETVRLHAVTDDAVLAATGFVASAAAVLAAGGTAIALHLRGHATPGRRLFDLAVELLEAAGLAGARLVVNDRVDVAVAAGADGVQLGKRGLPVGRVRRLPDVGLIGYSAHSAGEAAAAAAAGADWVVVGTIWETGSHEGRPSGPALLREAAAQTAVPVLAIGGVAVERVGEALAAGAAGVAVRSGIWNAPDAAAAVVAYRRALEAVPARQGREAMQSAETVLVTVNGEPRELPAGLSVADLLRSLGLEPGLVVVEHNGIILERARVAGAAVRGGDVFEIVHFVGGG